MSHATRVYHLGQRKTRPGTVTLALSLLRATQIAPTIRANMEFHGQRSGVTSWTPQNKETPPEHPKP